MLFLCQSLKCVKNLFTSQLLIISATKLSDQNTLVLKYGTYHKVAYRIPTQVMNTIYLQKRGSSRNSYVPISSDSIIQTHVRYKFCSLCKPRLQGTSSLYGQSELRIQRTVFAGPEVFVISEVYCTGSTRAAGLICTRNDSNGFTLEFIVKTWHEQPGNIPPMSSYHQVDLYIVEFDLVGGDIFWIKIKIFQIMISYK